MSGAICSICKVLLIQGEDETELMCPDCNRKYLPSKEIMSYQDAAFESSHSDEMPEISGIGGGGAGLLAASEDEDMNLTDMLYKKPKHAPNRGEGASTWES